MAERADVTAGLGIARGAQDHVLEIDPAFEALLVFLEDRREDVEERPGAFALLHPVRLGLAILQAVAAALELAQEGSEQLREVVDLFQLDDPVIDRVDWPGFQGDMRCQFFGEARQQVPLLPIIAVGLDQGGFVLGMDLALPCHASQVFVAVDERRRDQPLAAVGHLLAAHPEMLDVDAGFGQPEIRLVVAPARFGDLVFVDRLVLVFDAVLVKPVGDLQLFVTLDLFALERAQVLRFHVGVEVVLGLEVPFGLGLDQEMREELDDRPRHI